MATIGWELYRSFLSVLNEGSLSGAARAMGVAQPTIGRHIAALEKAFGLTLFTRSQLGLIPTEAALDLKSYAEEMSSMAAALKRAAESQGEGIRGVVRISASEVMGAEVLPPIITTLQREHPKLKIEMVLTNRLQNLLHREADIAIRMIQPKQESLIARRLGEVELGFHAHKNYLNDRGTPLSWKDFSQHSIIGFDEETPFLRSARRSTPAWNRDAFSVRTDSDLAQLALIRSGCGIGVCQVGLAKRDPQLVRVLKKEFNFKLESWLTMHEDLRNSPRCKITFETLLQGLQTYFTTQ
ncbi:MAG TPA: LysR family transcriptional regulator [Cellvibrio sp.]|nr:LysR family transcriptional regulator [Cellvibrio sp.]